MSTGECGEYKTKVRDASEIGGEEKARRKMDEETQKIYGGLR